MIISATIATSSPITAAKRAPTSHAGTAAGMTIFRTVVTGEKLEHSRDVVLARVNGGNTAGRIQDDRPQRGVDREHQLGRDSRPESQDRNRHERDGRDCAQEVDRGHHIPPQRR